MWVKICLIGFTSLITAVSQLLFKRSTGMVGLAPADAGGYTSFIIKLLELPSFIVALALYAVAFLLWIYLLSRNSLSILYPIGLSLNVVLALILSRAVLAEPIRAVHILGVGVIILGIFIVLR